MALVEDDQKIREIQREYLDFLDDEEDQGIYQQKVRDMITDNEVRLVVNINELRRNKPTRAQEIMTNSFEEISAFQKALKEFVASVDPVYCKQHDAFYIALEGSFGSRHLSPRTLSADHLGNMVCVEGIVTKCSLVRPKVVLSVHYCPATKKTLERRYTDMTSLDAFPTSAAYPTKDEDGNPLETEYGLCTYKDHQAFTIQEMPEKAPAGQLPRSVDIVADDDLVDKCKPGDRVQAIGMYRCLPGKKNGFTTGTFRTIIIVNNVKQMSKEVSPEFTAEDIAKIKSFSKRKDINVFDKLGQSLAPSICGHEYIKKALLCMLLGGTEKVLDNGTRIRGDINLLLIGDPSVAKSQLLRYVLHTAPRAVPTTGRGSSGVGLTAAVTTDQDSGDRRLEAGAMVLADRGVVCIDEFDKMSDIDRTAIHEVMEQGRVTIAKAGIHAKLNARCSVLAAANPVYGRYDQYKTPMENIGLQDSLLSRFDLLFIVLDKMDPEHDRMISDHVLRMHRYRATDEQDGDVLPMGSTVDVLTTLDQQEDNDNAETPMYEKYDHLLHGGSRKKSDKIISMKFMRKYIHVARDMRPVLTREAADYISEEYSKFRNQDMAGSDNVARTQPVTARALETLIRLSSAHAKSRLSKKVELQDAESAVELVQFAYFKKVLKKPKRKRSAEDGSGEEDEEEATPSQKSQSKKKAKRRGSADGSEDPYDFDNADEATKDDDPNPSLKARRRASRGEEAMDTTTTTDSSDVDPTRLKTFKASLLNLFKKEHAQSVTMDNVISFVNKENDSDKFSKDEIESALHSMMDENQVMVSDEVVFLI